MKDHAACERQTAPIVGVAMRSRRHGFTLIELVVTVAIIGVLAGLLLVAINAARESARRSQCANHLRQIGLALAAYHGALRSLPPAVIWSPVGEPLGGGELPIGVIDRVARYGDTSADTIYANWLILSLPYLDQAALFDRFQPGLPVGHAENAAVVEANMEVVACPSDSWSSAGNPYRRGLAAGVSDRRYARGNYALNVGPDKNCIEGVSIPNAPACVGGFLVSGTDLAVNNRAVWGAGVGGGNFSIRYSDVTDGLSHTVCVDETRAGLDAVDPRGVWALGQVGASLVARHGRHSEVGGPNACAAPGDQIIGCQSLVAKIGQVSGMNCDPAGTANEINAKSGARSLHPGGVQILFCDGSVHFEVNAVDIAIWHALHTRGGGERDSTGTN